VRWNVGGGGMVGRVAGRGGRPLLGGSGGGGKRGGRPSMAVVAALLLACAALLLLLALGALSLPGASEGAGGRGAGLARPRPRPRSHFRRSTFDSCVFPPLSTISLPRACSRGFPLRCLLL